MQNELACRKDQVETLRKEKNDLERDRADEKRFLTNKVKAIEDQLEEY